jgi:nucleoside-diphosphate-sugar epimerase
MQWAFVSDVAEACVRAMEVPAAAGEPFNVAHEPLTQRAFVERLAQVAGVTPTLVDIPRARIHAAGGEVIGANLYFGTFLDLPPHTEVVEKAPRLLGVVPTPLHDALRVSFEWYRTQPRRSIDYAFEDRLIAGV